MILLRTGALLLIASAVTSCVYYRREARPQRLARADVIVIPGIGLTKSGQGGVDLWNRMITGKSLLDRGFAPRIIVTGGNPRNGIREADKMLEYGLRLGIPEPLLIREPMARTTVENGLFSARIMVDRNYESALVVSHRWHLRYALPVFKDAFQTHGLELYWTPVDDNTAQSLGHGPPPDGLPATK